MWRTAVCVLALLCGAASGVVAAEAARPETLANGVVEVIFDPASGRITRFGFRDGGNVLWINKPAAVEEEYQKGGWHNWGGEKVWPGPQALWPFVQGRRWPPDPGFDGAPAVEVERPSPRELVATFPASPAWGVRLERTLCLDPERPVLTLRSRLTGVAPNRVPVQLWSVMQVPHPRFIRMEAAAMQGDGSTFINLNPARTKPPFTPEPLPDGAVTDGPEGVTVRPVEGAWFKAGTLGGRLAAVTAQGVLVQDIPFVSDGMYPELSSLQVLHNSRYVELETLSPARQLGSGEELVMETTWTLLPAEAGRDEATLTRSLRGLARPGR